MSEKVREYGDHFKHQSAVKQVIKLEYTQPNKPPSGFEPTTSDCVFRPVPAY